MHFLFETLRCPLERLYFFFTWGHKWLYKCLPQIDSFPPPEGRIELGVHAALERFNSTTVRCRCMRLPVVPVGNGYVKTPNNQTFTSRYFTGLGNSPKEAWLSPAKVDWTSLHPNSLRLLSLLSLVWDFYRWSTEVLETRVWHVFCLFSEKQHRVLSLWKHNIVNIYNVGIHAPQ